MQESEPGDRLWRWVVLIMFLAMLGAMLIFRNHPALIAGPNDPASGGVRYLDR